MTCAAAATQSLARSICRAFAECSSGGAGRVRFIQAECTRQCIIWMGSDVFSKRKVGAGMMNRILLTLLTAFAFATVVCAQSDDDRQLAAVLNAAADNFSQMAQMAGGSDGDCASQFAGYFHCQAGRLESGSTQICAKPGCSFGSPALAQLLSALDDQDQQANTALSGQGGSPILDTGNQQAAQLRAIGDANAAAQQNRIAQQQVVQSQVAQQQAIGSQASSSGPESCPRLQPWPDMGAHCNAVQGMNQCVKVVSTNFTGNASTDNYGGLTVVFENTCSQPIRLTASGSDNDTGQVQMMAPGQQFNFWHSQHGTVFHYTADDGTDCFVNADRPGCSGN